VRPARRSGIEFFQAGPDEIPEALAIEDADGGLRCEPGEEALQAVGGARRDCRGGNYCQRCRWLAQSLGIDSGLKNGLREQGDETIRAALGSDFAFDDVALSPAGDDEIHSFVSE